MLREALRLIDRAICDLRRDPKANHFELILLGSARDNMVERLYGYKQIRCLQCEREDVSAAPSKGCA
jgi:hypothetical protein